jgi:hypothetical protein
MNMLLNEIEMGLTPGYTLDLFAVLAVSQLFSVFSSFWGTIILYLIPLYILYKYGGLAASYFCGRKGGNENED